MGVPMAENCIFCKIINGELPADFVYKGENIVAFKDINPQAPIHILIVPKKHIRSINDIKEEDSSLLAEMIMVAKQLAKDLGTAESGYKLFFNVEKGGGQLIFHVHLHLIGGWQ